MGHKFAEIAFTDAVKRHQEDAGTRASYARMEAREDYNNRLGPHEAQFIAARDSFYMATVSEIGWPYMQHRGGPVGFLKVLDERRLAFADYRGNRQYVSLGNLSQNERVSLFFMDYPNRTRLKLLGRVRVIAPEEEALLARLSPDAGYRARVERGFEITLVGFDWNCPQHITPRYSQAEVEGEFLRLQNRIRELEDQLAGS
ncbi:pyridoxamine 5'-phosphate oxidase family protein [Shimia sp. MIT910701]|uniref:pyridoxamine 5'-phosphate oxidase family protein n=1 Tax=Shimia sp. MIT910701 TaxID=3096987 RepID=UPI00399B6B4B